VSIEQLDVPADIAQRLKDRCITNFMYMLWQSRKDLQHAFDLDTVIGQQRFCQWYDVSILREYGIAPQVLDGSSRKEGRQLAQPNLVSPRVPLHSRLLRLESTVGRIGHCLPRPIREFGKSIWYRVLGLTADIAGRTSGRRWGNTEANLIMPLPGRVLGEPGANLIGYAHAELGMGEHVRMTAAALSTTDVKFGVLDFNVGVPSRQQATLDHGQHTTKNIYRANVFHINADQMLKAYCHLGRDCFSNRYNIGYWAWELAECPNELVPVIGMVDEIWAPSRFIQNAFSEKTERPVEYMPLCVSLPALPEHKRSHYGLPNDAFLFLFTFDFFSYIDRKNPFAAIQAFKRAFPDRSTHVGLVIKVMHGDVRNPQWARMLEMIENDPRIHVINQTMSRSDVLGLFNVCDSFISLHRSEGFGRGPAEAMYLGKAVIVTNYSGNTDFTLQDNSCLVDYRLIPVQQGQYVFEEGQVWADAEVEHAAWYMKKLTNDSQYAKEIGLRGQRFIRENFSPLAIGTIYKERLQAIGII